MPQACPACPTPGGRGDRRGDRAEMKGEHLISLAGNIKNSSRNLTPAGPWAYHLDCPHLVASQSLMGKCHFHRVLGAPSRCKWGSPRSDVATDKTFLKSFFFFFFFLMRCYIAEGGMG